jgi:hypothetical protein
MVFLRVSWLEKFHREISPGITRTCVLDSMTIPGAWQAGLDADRKAACLAPGRRASQGRRWHRAGIPGSVGRDCEPSRWLERIGCRFWEETGDPAYRLFLRWSAIRPVSLRTR